MIKNINFKSACFINFIKKIKIAYRKNINNINGKPWVYKKYKHFFFKSYMKQNKILGVIVYCKRDLNYHINFLYILKQYRNKKIGYNLLQHLTDKKDKKIITTHVYKNFKRALNFYKKNNFVTYSKKINTKKINLIINQSKEFDKNVYNSKKLLILKRK